MKKKPILIVLLFFASVLAYPAMACQQNLSANEIALALGWVRANVNYCSGYYVEPLLDFSHYGLIKEKDTRIIAGSGSLFLKGRAKIENHVVVEQPNKQTEADSAIIYRDPKTNKITQVDLSGHVKVREPGRLLLGSKAQIKLDKKSGYIDHAIYRFSRSNKYSLNHGIRELFGLNGWGQASKMEQTKDGTYVFYNATYSTCPPLLMDWQLRARKIILDKNTNRGKAYHATFLIRDVPLLYLPYYSFPLHDQRKTGFIFGSFSHTKTSGFGLEFPFYWNIAPNYDATIAAQEFTKRGVMMKSQFRYLTPKSEGELFGTILPHDRAFKDFRMNEQNAGVNIDATGDNDRSYLHWNNQTTFNNHWSTSTNINYLSDDYYFQDFSNNIATTWQTQLVQQFDVNYFDQNWTFLGRAQNYQTLHPVNGTGVADVYGRLPELLVNGYYPEWGRLSDIHLKSELDYFRWPNESKASGGRYLIYPGFSVPLNAQWGYLKPRLDLHSRFYNLYNQTPTLDNDFSFVLPLVSLDGGLYFDREFNWFNQGFTQTLEPRLFYLYVPYANQNSLPLFDTGLYNFTYSQLFRTNRFSGEDRIGDANQLSLAVTTRILDTTTGHEKFKFGLGDIIYFQDRRVGYCSGTDIFCSDPINNINYTSTTSTFSPLTGTADYYFNELWRLNSDLAVAIDSPNTTINNGHLGIVYDNKHNRIISFHYDYQREILTTDQNNVTETTTLNQIGVSGSLPLNIHWSFLGALSYNLEAKHLQTSFVGMQYESCCWGFRAMAARTLTSIENQQQAEFNNGIYVQIQLKGLGTIGSSDAHEILTSNIPGFFDFLA